METNQPHQHSCLARVPIFNRLDVATTTKITALIHPSHYKKGEIIQQSGSADARLLVLSRGRAKVVRTSADGKEQIVGWLKPGDFTGEVTVFTGEATDNEVVALEDTSFCTLDSTDLKTVVADSPDLSMALIRELSLRLFDSHQQLESLGLMTAEQKLMARLTELAAGRQAFRLPMSKKDLAAELGMTPETLSRKFKQLADTNQITIDGPSKISLL